MKALRWVGIVVLALVVLFALAQLVRPSLSNPPEDPQLALAAHTAVDPAVSSLLDRSCADCHSHRTRWPGYSKIAPVSWLLAHDVNEGREKMNLSTWGHYTTAEQTKLLEKTCEDVREGEMPPAIYVWMHREAKLSDSDVTRLCQWADSTRATLGASSSATP